MALGVSPSRVCPDQSGYEAARKASVAKALAESPVQPAGKAKATRSAKNAQLLKAYSKNAKSALQARVALGMRR